MLEGFPEGEGIKTFADGFVDFPPMTLARIGTGLGKRHFSGLPGTLRIFEGVTDKRESDNVYVIEANIDDFNPEFFGYVFDTLFENGALDATLTPIIMKKGRPGQKLSVICDTKNLNALSEIILRETTTTGVRYHLTRRKKLKRESVLKKTPFGNLRVKKIFTKDGVRLHPEYEDLKKIAKKKKISITKLNSEILDFLAEE